jgi:uncharacterized damage-inducible protein DinB
MSNALASLLNEFREEAEVTRRVLDRIPGDKLTWKPHPKSMSLGQLADHIAKVPGGIAKLTKQDSFDASQANFAPPQPNTVEEIRTAFEQSVRDVEEYLSGMSDQTAKNTWRLMMKEKEVFSKPRMEVIRSLMLNHWYHHRGQLSVYLRLLDVAVPSIYGPSRDENPFG